MHLLFYWAYILKVQKSEPDMKNMSQIWKIWARSIFGSDFPHLAQIFLIFGSDFFFILAQFFSYLAKIFHIWLRWRSVLLFIGLFKTSPRQIWLKLVSSGFEIQPSHFRSERYFKSWSDQFPFKLAVCRAIFGMWASHVMASQIPNWALPTDNCATQAQPYPNPSPTLPCLALTLGC